MNTFTVQIKQFPDGRVDTDNAAIYLGLAKKTLAMMRCDGSGPIFLKRGRVYYYLADLDTWLQKVRSKTTAQSANKHKQEAKEAKEIRAES